MAFLKSLFRNRNIDREGLRRYVEIEFSPAEHESQYRRMLREAGL